MARMFARRGQLGTLAAALLAMAAVVPAIAQDTTKPAPTSCDGVAFTDPTGDAVIKEPVNGTSTGQKAADNFDIKRGFLRTVTVAGKAQTTANIEIANLDKSRQQGSDATSYWFYFTVGDDLKLALGLTDGTGWKFYYGSQSPDGFLIEGETTGRAIEGADGIVEIVLPSGMGISKKQLSKPYALAAATWLAKGDPIFGTQPILYQDFDRGPDAEGGTTFANALCDETGGGTGGTGGTGNTGTGGTGGTGGSGTGGTGGTGGAGTTPPPAQNQPATITLSAKAGKLSASKLKKGKAVKVSLTSNGKLASLTGSLSKGSKVFAKGSLGSLDRSGSISLKVSKKLKAGKYVIRVSGKDVVGRTVTATAKVTVKK